MVRKPGCRVKGVVLENLKDKGSEESDFPLLGDSVSVCACVCISDRDRQMDMRQIWVMKQIGERWERGERQRQRHMETD